MRCLVLLVASVIAQFVYAQNATAADDQSKPELITIVHYPKSGSVAGMSKNLLRLIGPQANIVELVDQNMLLVQVPVDQQAKVSKLIQAVDIAKPVVRYRVYWIRSKEKLSSSQLESLSGKESGVKKAFDRLRPDGRILEHREFETTSLINTQCFIRKTEQTKVVLSTMKSSKGPPIQSVGYDNSGTNIQLTGLATGSSILVDFDLSVSIAGPVQGTGDDDGKAEPAKREFEYQSTLRINDGEAKVVTTFLDESNDKKEYIYVVFGAAKE